MAHVHQFVAPPPKSERCATCGGTGQAAENRKCWICDGTGRKPTYVIEKNIPIPPKVKGRPGGAKANYPFKDMEIGDSFHCGAWSSQVATACSKFSRGHPEYQFTIRQDRGGIRVWRIKAKS